MKSELIVAWGVSAFLLLGSVLQAQYKVNEKIEAEDLDRSGDCIRVSHGAGWAEHSSNFIYATCGNRHWLCDYRVIPRCQYNCCDKYVSVPITIPEDGDYVVYAYVANWADSAGIVGNKGCGRNDKWECAAWFVAWDDVKLLNKVLDAGGNENVPKEYLWKTYPYNKFCGRFDLDLVSLGYDRLECPGGDPRECDFPATQFKLMAGKHTLYIKASEEYTLLDWLYVAIAGDPAPTAEAGRPWQQTGIDEGVEGARRPDGFALKQNYPNPFNAGTIIEYAVPREATVKLAVYNMPGQEISVLVNSVQAAGHYTVTFDASELPSGTYLYKMEATCQACGGRKTLFSEGREMGVVR